MNAHIFWPRVMMIFSFVASSLTETALCFSLREHQLGGEDAF